MYITPISRPKNALLSARWLIKSAFVWRRSVGGPWIAVESRSISSVRTLDGGVLSDFTLLNATAALPIRASGLTVSLSVFNALGTRYEAPAGQEHAPQLALPQPGRVVMLRLAWTGF